MDSSLSRELMKVMKKQGVKFYLSHQVNSVKRKGKMVEVKAKDKKDSEVVFEGDYCLVSVGRKPFTENLNLEKVGISLNNSGQVEVNEKMQTSVSNIYAIGDVVRDLCRLIKQKKKGNGS